MSARQLLLFGGLALAILGITYGLWYAVFAEHQALDGIGVSLTTGFQAAAQRNPADAEKALLQYRQAKYNYDRQVDVHGHWLGLSMLLIVLAIASDQISIAEKWKLLFALGLLLGSVLFPFGVLMQTWSHGQLPRIVTIAASGLLIAAVGFTTLGFLRQRRLMTH